MPSPRRWPTVDQAADRYIGHSFAHYAWSTNWRSYTSSVVVVVGWAYLLSTDPGWWWTALAAVPGAALIGTLIGLHLATRASWKALNDYAAARQALYEPPRRA